MDVILVDYHYGATQFERFFYAKQYGWVRWELWNSATQHMDAVATWDTDDAVTLAVTTRPPKCDNY